jgi:hypothetical protein
LQRPCVRRSALTQCPTCNGRPPPAEGQGPLGSRGVWPLGARAPLSPGHHHFHPPAAKAGTDEPMALVENGGFDAVPSSHLGGIGTYRDAANVRLRSMAVLQVLESGGGSEIAESRAEDLTR